MFAPPERTSGPISILKSSLLDALYNIELSYSTDHGTFIKNWEVFASKVKGKVRLRLLFRLLPKGLLDYSN